jgi:hypothetical protein
MITNFVLFLFLNKKYIKKQYSRGPKQALNLRRVLSNNKFYGFMIAGGVARGKLAGPRIPEKK